MLVDARLFAIAHGIASRHVKKRFFESYTSELVRKIRLRTEIYNALATEAGRRALESRHADCGADRARKLEGLSRG